MHTENSAFNIAEIPGIADRFTCPICKNRASIVGPMVQCSNEKCGAGFPIIGNVPILINESNSIFRISDYVSDKEIIVAKKNSVKKILDLVLLSLPSISNNLSSKNNFRLLRKLLRLKNDPKVLVIGGAEITTDTEMIFDAASIVIESDVYFGKRTQVIVDAHDIPFEDETFDLVICQAVLEHVADPYRCIQEVYRVLKSEGLVYAMTPFMQQVHMKAYDFTRFTHLGHRRLFRHFEEIDSGVFAGTGVALGWSIKYFVGSFINNKYIRKSFQVLASVSFSWLKYFDYLTRNNKSTYNGASGFYFIGRKSINVLSDNELILLYRGT